MDIFSLQNKLIKDYSEYIRSFISIRDERIKSVVDDGLGHGLLWPDPLIQLNPFFQPAKWLDELVDEGLLHSECKKIFRGKKDEIAEGTALRLHLHQEAAVRTAKTDHNYVLTTGTGSGKSLAYIIPIVDHVLRNGSGKGIQAIIIYPMNALVNSQWGELEKFLCHGYPPGRPPVTFDRYTGQEREEERKRIIANPPDILLTNYMMMELMLTRPDEKQLITRAEGMRFLVLDELHTYRGRQGADVAFLVRRIRDRLARGKLICVGTSATLARDGGTVEDQQAEISDVASLIFGDAVKPEHVIVETLQRSTFPKDITSQSFLNELKTRLLNSGYQIPTGFENFRKEPLAIWIENTFGLETDAKGRLIRARRPPAITGPTGAAHILSQSTGVSEGTCQTAIEQTLLAGYRCPNPETGFPVFAFRVHQFISRGDTVYASPEAEAERHITLQPQNFVPGSDKTKILLPLSFCRHCGQEYYAVRTSHDEQRDVRSFIPRECSDFLDNEVGEAGFLYISTHNRWPSDPQEVIQRLPDDWLDATRSVPRIRPNYQDYLPQAVKINAKGEEATTGVEAQYFPVPFRFCLQCGVSYRVRRGSSDFPRIATLSSEGRSTATTILSLSVILGLKQQTMLAKRARKLLSFTDNRQDASLQSGHFNDFIEVGLLRGALYQACSSASDGITHEILTQKVFEAMSLPKELYAGDPTVRFQAEQETNRALREVLGYRLYRDLRRGWRINLPNLEQCGLLKIDYISLEDVCAAQDVWQDKHAVLQSATPATRRQICQTLLDFMRSHLAIKVDYLEPAYQERIQQLSSQRLKSPWALDESERRLDPAAVLYPRPRRAQEDSSLDVFLSVRSQFGQYLKRPNLLSPTPPQLSSDDILQLCRDLLESLRAAGIVERVRESRGQDETAGYQIVAASLRWRAGDGTSVPVDPLRMSRESAEGGRPNPFFKEFYTTVARDIKDLRAFEHTAQVAPEEREEREDKFREAEIPILFCSPTMELGIDIRELNVVNMRNVPPTPANYAQRSGRAGRSGQPALVFSYCTSGSPHDQYFFKRPFLMVSGSVTPPRLDLTNQDLVRAHIQAIWLAETGQSLHKSLKDILDINGDPPSLMILPSINEFVRREEPRQRAKQRAESVLHDLKDKLTASPWYSDTWLSDVLTQVVQRFDQTCDRWRGLYRAALRQFHEANRIIADASRSQPDTERARQRRNEAESQLNLLKDYKNIVQSDFYSYRYFASEGFLPGYNFPRLPLSAFIPGRRVRGRGDDEYLSRPRFLAISEFGPRAIIYHEGSRYRIVRVILPVADDSAADGRRLQTAAAKICPECGYLHPQAGGAGADRCEYCSQMLDSPLTNLFRMQNVTTRRQDRITADEEERQRMGYELTTAVQFSSEDGRSARLTADVTSDGTSFAHLTYGHAARIWRINLGWSRRANPNQFGFLIDTETGRWEKNPQVADDEDDDADVVRPERVIPYVEDHRNCLIFRPPDDFEANAIASLQAALKNAIQVMYQLEDNELAAQPLPDRDDRSYILFYESAEGGAGVLRRLVEEPGELNRLAREALRLCHFNRDTGEDLRRSPRATEDCESACYDCLMSYFNQGDHLMLDRHLIRDYLLSLAVAAVVPSPTEKPRAEHLHLLKKRCDTELERHWLDFLEHNNLRLPTGAQELIAPCSTRPDFIYEADHVAVYVDGPAHDFPDRQTRDQTQTDCMENLGHTVIRFHHADDWLKVVKQYPYVFGCKA